MMKNGWILLMLTLFSGVVIAQDVSTKVNGVVKEAETGEGVPFATVVLVSSADQSIIAGNTTDDTGKFSLTTNANDFYVRITSIGFADKEIKDFEIIAGIANLGEVKIAQSGQALDEVIVRAEKSQTTFELDKRVFNVGKDLSSTGASAMEVLNNVPSVNVTIEGQIQLRGSGGVQILINGKPSVLASESGNALGSITADMIEKIEVITNPSAKYEAEGTSGIINIIIKKEERKGINGSMSLNTGVPANHSLGFSMNKRSEKLNLFTQIGVGSRSRPNFFENENRDLTSGNTVLSEGEDFRNETFYNVVLGADYYFSDRDVLTVTGNYVLEMEDQPSFTSFQFLNADREVLSSWEREEETTASNPKWQYEVNYKKEFKDNKEHSLLFSAQGNFFGKDQSSDFINTTLTGDRANELQQTRTNYSEIRNTIKIDYTKPFSEQFTLEAGGQYLALQVTNDFEVSNFEDGSYVSDPAFTNIFDFDQSVLGVYSTLAYEGKKFGVKGGLRLEDTNVETFLRTNAEPNDQRFANLFPSFSSSYKVNNEFSLQASYSKRIYRPRLWDLNPFFNIRNNFMIRAGNPDLLPEFTDSYEFMSIYQVDKASFNLGVYYRYTTGLIESVTTVTDNVNLSRPLNLGTSGTTGVEFNAEYNPSKWLRLTSDFNYNYFNREGQLESLSFDFAGDQWSAEIGSRFKLAGDFDIEASANYRSRVQTVQSLQSANLFFDIGFRKKILKGRSVLNLSVRDIFASRFRESVFDQPGSGFYQYSFSQRGRFIAASFSFGFGKGEAMEYSGSRRR